MIIDMPELTPYRELLTNGRDLDVLLQCLELTSGGSKKFGSFELHAPLELIARYKLLPYVDERSTMLARAQMLVTALEFAGLSEPFEAPQQETVGSLVGINETWPEISRNLSNDSSEPSAFLEAIAPRAATNIGAAGHCHILVGHMLREEPGISRLLWPHFRMYAYFLAGDVTTAGGALIENLEPLTGASAESITRYLKDIPPNEAQSEYPGIRGVVDRARGALPVASCASVEGHLAEEKFLAACTTAAEFMLVEATELKYGWTHCLNLAEAAWSLADHQRRSDPYLHVALSYVASFISSIRTSAEVTRPGPAGISRQSDLAAAIRRDDGVNIAPLIALGLRDDDVDAGWRSLITIASERHDAHLVKYAYACFKCAGRSHDSDRIFLAALAKLSAHWLGTLPMEMTPSQFLSEKRAG